MYETKPRIDDDIPVILTMVALVVWMAFYMTTNNFLLSLGATALVFLITFIGYLIYKYERNK